MFGVIFSILNNKFLVDAKMYWMKFGTHLFSLLLSLLKKFFFSVVKPEVLNTINGSETKRIYQRFT